MAGGNADLVVRVAANLSALQADMSTAAASIKTIEATTTSASEAAQHYANTLTDLAKELGIAFSIERGIEFLKGVAEEAKALQVLSLQTQIGVEDLQVLSAATREYGVDGEQVGRAIYQLSRRVAGGDESVATAYHLMGKSIEEVKGLNQMELFLTTERALGTLHGTIRDTAAADLYGGRLGVSMGAFATGVDESMEEARKLIFVAGPETTAAAAEYARSLERMTTSLHAWTMELEGKTAQGLNVLSEAVTKGASQWAIYWAMLKDTGAANYGLGTGTENLTRLLVDLNQKTEHGKDIQLESAKAHGAVTVALDAHGQAAQFMAALELDSAKPLLAWQTEYLVHLKDIGELTAKNAQGIGVNVEQFKNYEVASRKAAEAAKEYDAIIAHMDQETFKLAQEHEKQWREERLRAASLVNAAVLLELDATVKLNAEWGLNAVGALTANITAIDRLNLSLDELHKHKVEGISQAAQEQLLIDAYTAAVYNDALAEDAATAARAEGNAELAKVPGLCAAAVDGFHQIAAASAAASLGKTDAGSFDKFTHMTTGETAAVAAGQFVDLSGVAARWNAMSNSAKAAIEGRASGGAVSSGSPYVVGERGPELFVPQSAGSIVPNSGGGSVNVTIHVTQPLGTPDAIARAVGDALTTRLRSLGVRT